MDKVMHLFSLTPNNILNYFLAKNMNIWLVVYMLFSNNFIGSYKEKAKKAIGNMHRILYVYYKDHVYMR